MGGLDDLAEAAAQAHGAPEDLGAWLRLCRALEATGEANAAESFEALGRAASQLGAVALAVACARWLAAKHGPASRALIEQVAREHGEGVEGVDAAARGRPPAPPPGDRSPAPELPTSLTAAKELAKQAVEAAVQSAAKRRPAALPPTPLVRALRPAELRELAGVMRLEDRAAGDMILDVGDRAENLYWIARGAVSVTRGEHYLGEVRSNAFFGEIALLAGTRRTARVTCSEPTWLLTIPRASIEELAGRVPRLGEALANYARQRLLANVMRTSELFVRLGDEERQSLLPRFATRFYPAGEHVVRKGCQNDHFFVLVSGVCEVRNDDGVTAVLGVGDGIGEMSIISRKLATADVIVTRDAVALVLDRNVFDEIAVDHPGLLAEVYKLLLTREQTNERATVHNADSLVI